jgi:hypothetical protein
MLAIENRRSRCCRFMAAKMFKVLTSSKCSKMLRFCIRQSAPDNKEKEKVIEYVTKVNIGYQFSLKPLCRLQSFLVLSGRWIVHRLHSSEPMDSC